MAKKVYYFKRRCLSIRSGVLVLGHYNKIRRLVQADFPIKTPHWQGYQIRPTTLDWRCFFCCNATTR